MRILILIALVFLPSQALAVLGKGEMIVVIRENVLDLSPDEAKKVCEEEPNRNYCEIVKERHNDQDIIGTEIDPEYPVLILNFE